MYQPGVVPLRPLRLGDVFGGAVTLTRRNPRATVGTAAVVSFGFMLVPTVATLLFAAGGLLPSMDPLDTTSSSTSDVSVVLSTVVNGVFSLLSSVVVTGLMVPVVEGGLVGRRVSAGESWRRARGRLPRLVALSLLTGLAAVVLIGVPVGLAVAAGVTLGNEVIGVLTGVLGGLLGLAATVFLYVRVGIVSSAAVVVERSGVVAALRRSWSLTAGAFWRLLGIYLLAALAAYLVSQVLTIPITLVGTVVSIFLPAGWSTAGILVTGNLASVVTGAVVGPFTGAVVALLYFDLRFRREGLDIELLNRALTGGQR